MNMRLACDQCGSQPCMCQTFDCPACEGKGQVDRQHLRPQLVDCDTCKGEGEAKCNGPDAAGHCPFVAFIDGDFVCHCEAAWERQQEDYASEPPPSARERQLQAQAERDALRSGRPA